MRRLKAKEKCICGNDINRQVGAIQMLVKNLYFFVKCLKCERFVEVDIED